MSADFQLIITVFATIDRAQSLIHSDQDWAWVYFGKNIEQFLEIKKSQLSSVPWINGGELVNAMAKEIRDEFLNFDKHFEVNVTDVAWQTSQIVGKNPYESPLFYDCCAYMALIRLLESGRKLLVVLEDSFLARIMSAAAGRRVGKRHVTLLLPSKERWPLWLYQIIADAWSMLRAVKSRAQFLKQFHRKRLLLVKNAAPPWDRLRLAKVLLVAWADHNSFPPDHPGQSNTYFGRLPSALNAARTPFGYIANPTDWVSPYSEIVANCRSAKDPVVLVEDCLTLWTAWRVALRSLFRRFRPSSPCEILGIDLTCLVKHAFLMEWSQAYQCRPWLFYCLPAALKRHGVRPHAVMLTMENQPWEKALRLGFRKYLPKTRFLGFQHTPFSKFWLPYFPSHADLYNRQIPDAIVMIGTHWRDTFLSAGYPRDRLYSGMALRHEHVWAHQDESLPSEQQSPHAPFTVLVVCPIGYQDSLELLHKSVQTFSEATGTRVLLKFHPKLEIGADQLLAKTLALCDTEFLPPHFQVTTTSIHELLGATNLVIYNSSSVAFEALARQIPSVFVTSDIWLDLDPVPENFPMSYRVRSSTDMRHIATSLMRPSTQPISDQRPKMASILAPVTEAGLQELCIFLTRNNLSPSVTETVPNFT